MRLSEKMNGMSTNVNLLRFVAALLVVFSHSFYVAASLEDPFSVFCHQQTNFGGVAVAIFFFLSGFYVTKSLYKKNDVKEYMFKRCIRIFPQLWIVILLSVFVLGPVLTSSTMGAYFGNKETYLYLLNMFLIPTHNLPGVFVNNVYSTTINGPLWTMPVEFIAYCGLAIILIVSKSVLKNEKLQKMFHTICLVVLMVLFVIIDMFVKNDFLITVLRPMVIFFVGVLYCNYSEKIKLNISLAIVMITTIFVTCRIGLLNYALIIGLPYVIVTLVLGTKQIKLNGKLLAISYEIYLLGWPIQQIVTELFGGRMNPYLNWIIAIPFVVIVAYFLFVVIEKIEKVNL